MNKQSVTYLKDYEPPRYWIDRVDLNFDLSEDKTTVVSTINGRCNDAFPRDQAHPLVLQGEKLRLRSVQLNNQFLDEKAYQVDERQLIIPNVPDQFVLTITVEIDPKTNTELSGLYRSNNLYCTQCEPEGFRRITYYLDRPDVMAKFTTTLQADQRLYPVLLSNGNCVGSGELGSGRHWVKWEDPHPKPCYLFALVAGNLTCISDHFVTRSNRLVQLRIYTEPHNQDQCYHAMQALKKAMEWDELTYGREYDLSIYMIVAVSDFNMGAMENKGLNIFNTKYILARSETATDVDFQLIDAVVGHEYFHNWSGNRITCRDWFQLSLKEGLTVFREHQFSLAVTRSAVQLIDQVSYLKNQQFSEDRSPMAHPVRPASYSEINNFYTATVYEKGAEVIRMLQTLLGKDNFRRAMDGYFETYDGQAVTTDDFLAAMQKVATIDLAQFRLWYTQAGTPEIVAEEDYQGSTQTYRLTLKQSCPATPNQSTKEPMVIPIAMGLLDEEGNDLPLQNPLVILTEPEKTYEFSNIQTRPVLSLLRGFSAPVKVHLKQSREALAFLLAHDSDDFNRWDAGQRLTIELLWDLSEAIEKKQPLTVDPLWLNACRAVLGNAQLNPAFRAKILTLPGISYLMELGKEFNLDCVVGARKWLTQQLASHCLPIFLENYHAHLTPGPYQWTPDLCAKRRLRDLCLGYLLLLPDPKMIDLSMQQWADADSMTDRMGVLSALIDRDCHERNTILQEFYDKWQHNPLVLDKWFAIQARSELPGTLEVVKKLLSHPAFDLKNPNKVYALVGGFCSGNVVRFHEANGEGYKFLADRVLELDPINPQVAARMARAFSNWKNFDLPRQEKMHLELKRIEKTPSLSTDVREIVSKCLEMNVLEK